MKTIYKHEHKKEIFGQSNESISDKFDNKQSAQTPEIIDKTKEQKTVEPKKDNAWIWGLVALVVIAAIYFLIDNKENEKAN